MRKKKTTYETGAYIEIVHLVDDEGVVAHQHVAPDDDQVREHGGQRAQALDAVQEEVAVDLAQLGERNVGEVLDAGIVDERDVHEPFHDGAVFQFVEVFHRVADVHALAHCKQTRRRRKTRTVKK